MSLRASGESNGLGIAYDSTNFIFKLSTVCLFWSLALLDLATRGLPKATARLSPAGRYEINSLPSCQRAAATTKVGKSRPRRPSSALTTIGRKGALRTRRWIG